MMNKLVILLACLSLGFQVSSCTSKESQADSEVAADVDSADLEKLEGDESLQVAGDDSLASDQLPEEALGETTAPAETTTTTETTTETTEKTVGDDAATTQQMDVATTTETLPADPLAQTADVPSPTPEPALEPTEPTLPSHDNVTMAETTMKTEHSTTIVENPEPAKSVSLQKVANTPWKVGKKWFNTVYFARPGDTLSSVSQMIYGANKVAELKKGNPTFKSRGLKPGDKIYYNSPNRPDDSAKMITYYEDNGMAPETYVANAGDNIRKVSKKLLGHSNAWKEIWASNSVDSKGELPEGTELRYWKGGPVAATAAPAESRHNEVAAAAPVVPEQQPLPPAPPAEEPMAAAQQQAQAEIPPPPPMPEQPPTEMAPPPPPPPVEALNPPAPKPMADEEVAPEGMDQDTTLALAVVGLAAAGLAALIVVRKKRKQRELEQALDSTHVGT